MDIKNKKYKKGDRMLGDMLSSPEKNHFFFQTTNVGKIEKLLSLNNLMLPHQRTLQATVTNQNMASTQVNQKQLLVDKSTNIVKEHLDSVKNIVAQVLEVMRVWRSKFQSGNTKLNQQSMWHKYKKTNTVPVDQLNKFFSRTELPNLEHMFKNMFSGKGGYAIADQLWQFRELYHVEYEKHNHANGVRIFVGEFERDWVKDEYNDLFISFVFECVFSHRLSGTGKSPFDHPDKTYNPLSVNKLKSKWLKNFDVKEFAYVAGLIIFILGEPQFRLYEAQQNRTLYTPSNGSAFLKRDPNAKEVVVPVATPNFTIPVPDETWEDDVETVQDVAPEPPELIHYTWDDDDEVEEKAAEQVVEEKAAEQVVEEKAAEQVVEKKKEKPEKRKRKSKRMGKRERDEKRWAEDALKPDGWDLPDLPEDK